MSGVGSTDRDFKDSDSPRTLSLRLRYRVLTRDVRDCGKLWFVALPGAHLCDFGDGIDVIVVDECRGEDLEHEALGQGPPMLPKTQRDHGRNRRLAVTRCGQDDRLERPPRCGVEIGLKRLEARPTATLCIDCKTLDEIREKQVAK